MGGKPSNMYQWDRGEAGTTDHKFLEKTEELKTQDEQQLAEQASAEAGGSVPRDGEHPVLSELDRRREQSERDQRREREGE